jgi:hypothetical protein
MPDPIAMSSAAPECNEACLPTMASMHTSMVVDNFKLLEEDLPRNNNPLILNSSSGIVIAN